MLAEWISAVRDRVAGLAEEQVYRRSHAAVVATLALLVGVLLEQRSWLSAAAAGAAVAAVVWLGPDGLDPEARDDFDPEWDDEYGEELRPGLRVVRNDPRRPW